MTGSGTPESSAEEWARPLPNLDEVSTEYWAAGARGELRVQECGSCGHRQFYPRLLCTKCGKTPGWLTCSGRGVIHTFTVIRQNHAKPFRNELPYVVAMVELEEGPRMMGNVLDCPVEDVRIGMPVQVVFEAADEGVGVPFWRPTAG